MVLAGRGTSHSETPVKLEDSARQNTVLMFLTEVGSREEDHQGSWHKSRLSAAK